MKTIEELKKELEELENEKNELNDEIEVLIKDRDDHNERIDEILYTIKNFEEVKKDGKKVEFKIEIAMAITKDLCRENYLTFAKKLDYGKYERKIGSVLNCLIVDTYYDHEYFLFDGKENVAVDKQKILDIMKKYNMRFLFIRNTSTYTSWGEYYPSLNIEFY